MKSSLQESCSAYIDGELSVSESQALNDVLSPGERGRLEAEIRLESAIADALGTEEQCPDEIWHGVLNRLDKQRTSPKRVLRFRLPRAWWWTGAAAACFCVVLVWHRVHTAAVATAEFLRVPASIGELAAVAQVRGDHQQVQAFLNEHGVGLPLRRVSEIKLPPGHTATLIGARTSRYGGDEVVELLYECCGEPAKLIVARQGSVAAEHIATAARQARIQSGHHVAGYQIGIVSDHNAREFLQVFAGTV